MNDTIFVVETADDAFLGTIEFVEGGIVVRNGYVGRPVFVEQASLVRVLPADEHPLIESVDSNNYFRVG